MIENCFVVVVFCFFLSFSSSKSVVQYVCQAMDMNQHNRANVIFGKLTIFWIIYASFWRASGALQQRLQLKH